MKYATNKTINELEDMFRFVPPKRLSKRLTYLLLDYLQKTPVDDLPQDFNKIAEDVHFLIRFLNLAQKQREKLVYTK
jgi:hypothetical protein